MAHIRVVRRHGLPLRDARKALERAIDGFAERYGVRAGWRGDVLAFSIGGAAGEVRVTKREIRLEVTLGMLAMPFRGQLASRIESHLDEVLVAARRS